jgi:hypothetical protein
MKRRQIDPGTKLAAILEGLKGESSIAEICRKYQISESLYIAGGTSSWRPAVGPWLPVMALAPRYP